MKENWSDFEKYVFQKLGEMSEQISQLKTQAAVWGALAGLISVVLAEGIARAIFTH